MAKLAPLLISILVVSSAVGCDSRPDADGCVYSDTPDVASGSRSRCARSTFKEEDRRAREVAGIVRRGEDVVPGALVRVEAWGGLPTGKTSAVASTVTDSVGFFGGLRPAALRYDLLTSFGEDASGATDVLVYRGVGWRYFEPSLEVDTRTLPRVWSGRFDVRFDADVPDDQAVAFFATGDDVFDVEGDAATGLTLHMREYTARATLHAIAFDKNAELSTAKAYGKVEVVSAASVRQIATVHLDPIATFVEPRFVATGASPKGVDVIIGFSRSSGARLATVPIGAATRLPVIPNAGYTYRARVEVEDGLSDTGEVGFDAYKGAEVTLPALAVVERPAVGEALGAGARLVASGEGVFEHVLVPAASHATGVRLRIVTSEPEAAVPDLRELGLAPVVGLYTWSVRSFPSVRYPEELSGTDARRYRPMSATKSRVIELR